MIQRMSDEHKISFLDAEEVSKKTKASETVAKKTLEQLSEEQKSKKLANKDDGHMTTHTIFSARTGAITDEGGPSTFAKSDSSNTIFNNDKTAEASKEIDSKTKTAVEKEKIASNKREAESQRMNDLVEGLASTLQDKTATVSSAGTLSGTNYQVSDNSMSIFDNKDFMRLQDKTGGEKISEDIKNKKSQVDDSWKSGGKVVSSKSIASNLFDGLFNKSE